MKDNMDNPQAIQKKTTFVKSGSKSIPINIIIHNPNPQQEFDEYYSALIIETIKTIRG